MALSTFAAGSKLRASQLNALVSAIDNRKVGFATRATNGTTTTTAEKTYQRIDAIPIVNGYDYLIITTPMIFESSVAADMIQIFLRGSAAGAATTASTALTLLSQPSRSASGAQYTAVLAYSYSATTTGSLSLLLSYLRALGTGNVRINASTDIPVQINVYNMGLTVPDTGVDL